MTPDEPRTVLLLEPQPAAAAGGEAGEQLFEFKKAIDHYSCELRDHGEYGIEAQFLLNGDLYIARTFQDQPDLGLRARDMTIAWASHQRQAMEAV